MASSPRLSGVASREPSGVNSRHATLLRCMRHQSSLCPLRNSGTLHVLPRAPAPPFHGPIWKTQSFLLSEICTVTFWQDCYGKRNLRESSIGHGWENFLNFECLFVNRARGLFLSEYVDDIKLAGKTKHIEPSWKILMEDVDLGEPASFLDHVYLGCTQRECQFCNDVVANYRDMFESRICVRAEEKLPTKTSVKLDADTRSSWSDDMESHVKKCVERYCELAHKRINNYTKSQRHAWMTINV